MFPENDSENDPPNIPPGRANWERVTAVSAGLVFLVVLLVIATLVPTPSPFQEFVFRVVLAIAAAAFGSTVPGLLEIDVGVGTKFVIRAAGALALFVAVYLVNPPRLIGDPPSNVLQPKVEASGSCTTSDLALTMEIDGHLIPGRRGGSGLRFAGGRLYQFTLANASKDCTAIIKNIQLAVLASVRDTHEMREATTADNSYEVMVSPDSVGQKLELNPLKGAPKAQWGYHFTPKSNPDRFKVHVIPTPWGYSYAIQFVVTWYDPTQNIEMLTQSKVYAAFFPDNPTRSSLFDLDEDAAFQFRRKQQAAWSKVIGTEVH